MSVQKIIRDGAIVGFISRDGVGYTLIFPPEDTLKSFFRPSLEEIQFLVLQIFGEEE